MPRDKHAKSAFRKWRESEGLTLAEVAGLVGLSVPMISLVERGERRLAPMTRVQVARRLGVPIQTLFEPEVLEPELAASG